MRGGPRERGRGWGIRTWARERKLGGGEEHGWEGGGGRVSRHRGMRSRKYYVHIRICSRSLSRFRACTGRMVAQSRSKEMSGEVTAFFRVLMNLIAAKHAILDVPRSGNEGSSGRGS
jgi:hypothetical protein